MVAVGVMIMAPMAVRHWVWGQRRVKELTLEGELRGSRNTGLLARRREGGEVHSRHARHDLDQPRADPLHILEEVWLVPRHLRSYQIDK